MSETSLQFLISLATTTPNPQIDSFSDSAVPKNTWQYRSYPYFPIATQNLTLEYYLQLDNQHDWYLDDISVMNSNSNELIINGDFDVHPLTFGWTSRTNAGCSTNPGIGNAIGRANRSYINPCRGKNVYLEQTFFSIAGDRYNISFWFYLHDSQPNNNGGGGNPNRLTLELR